MAQVLWADHKHKRENYAPREVYSSRRNIEKVGRTAQVFTRMLMISGLLLTLWLANGLFNDIMQMQLKIASTTRMVNPRYTVKYQRCVFDIFYTKLDGVE